MGGQQRGRWRRGEREEERRRRRHITERAADEETADGGGGGADREGVYPVAVGGTGRGSP